MGALAVKAAGDIEKGNLTITVDGVVLDVSKVGTRWLLVGTAWCQLVAVGTSWLGASLVLTAYWSWQARCRDHFNSCTRSRYSGHDYTSAVHRNSRGKVLGTPLC